MSPDRTPLKLSFAQKLEAVPIVRKRVESYLLTQGCAKRAAEEVVLAVDELCNNAVQHGPSQGKTRLKLLVHVDTGAARCRLTVPSDMTATELSKMTETAELPDFESERGRGLFLIRMMVDDLSIRESGPGMVDMEFEKRL